MPVLKPSQDNEDDEQRLSILADIEKSATVRLKQYADISAKVTEPLIASGALDALTKVGKTTAEAMEKFGGLVVTTKPQSGVLGITDITASVKAVNDLANSPVFTYARDALATTREISENLTAVTTPIVSRIADMNKAIFEPMERLKETASVLTKVHNFDLSIKAIEAFPITHEHWMGKTYEIEPVTLRPPQIMAEIIELKATVSNLAAEIVEEVKVEFREQIDKLAEKGIINSRIKNQILHCKFCDEIICKVKDLGAYIQGIQDQRCPKCHKTLKIPQDLKIRDI
jgi:hypothetical protein